MILITGAMFSGKKTFVREYLCPEGTETACALWEVQTLAEPGMTEMELKALADRLAEKKVLIFTETGCGVVPMDPAERERREAAGRLGCLLAERAETVVRLYCGIPQVLKGRLEK